MPSSAMMNGPAGTGSPVKPFARAPFPRLALVPAAAKSDRLLQPRLGLSSRKRVRLRLISSD